MPLLPLHALHQDCDRSRQFDLKRHADHHHFSLALVELPFSSVKDSGYGSEGGSEAIEAYLSTKLVQQAGG